jgi:lipid-A-disaccharide synthase
MYGAELIAALRRCAAAKTSELRSRTGESAVSTPAEPGSAGQPGAAVPTHAVPTTENFSELEFFGVGGERMRAAGCDTVVDAKDLSVVGITEILSHLPKIYGLYQHLISEADKRRPDLAIVIDSPAFNWRVARQMKRRGVPVVYYVAPQFWAWRQGRVRLLREYVDKALVIFPFEEEFYRERGVDATFVGHPLAELARGTGDRGEYAARFALDPAKWWITLMPGSRVKEVRMNLPTMLEAAAKLGDDYKYLLPVAPTLERGYIQSLIGRHRITLVPEALPALGHSRAGIVASGTATVEAAMMGTPFVMVYCVSALTYFLGKPRVKVPHFAMVNLIAGEEIVPELVQHDFTAANVAARVQEILPEGEARSRMLRGMERVKQRLRGGEGGIGVGIEGEGRTPAERAAAIILDMATLG